MASSLKNSQEEVSTASSVFDLSALDGSEKDEHFRLMVRNACLKSTYAMAKMVIGFKDLTVQTHSPMATWIDYPSTRKRGLAPRDHLKTSVWTVANCVKRICNNPNIRILLANETATNASRFLRRIQSVWERNAVFRWAFPELVPDFSSRRLKWNETEMMVPRTEDYPEGTIDIIGVGGAVVSRHYDLIKLDDIVGREASQSDDVMRKAIEWYQLCESLLDHPVHSEIQLYGTRWGFNDVYRWSDENEETDKFTKPIEDEDGPMWPERFTPEAIDKLRRKYGSFLFSCQYMNDPRDPDATNFNPEHLRFYEQHGPICKPVVGPESDWRHMRRFLRVDPALSEDDKACDTAIIVDGVDKENRKWLLDTWAGHVNPTAMFDEIFRLAEFWDVESIGIEDVLFQKVLKHFFDQESERRGVYINVVGLSPGNKKSKKARIRGVQPYFERGEIHVKRTQKLFIKQYEEFPTGTELDLLDAFSYGPDMWELPELDGDEGDLERHESFRSMLFEGRNEATGY